MQILTKRNSDDPVPQTITNKTVTFSQWRVVVWSGRWCL